MAQRIVTALAIAVLLSTGLAADQGGARHRPVWTFVGMGAGFGVGLWAGLTAFDDSTSSDRKVWTSAIVGAAVGGVIGYLVDRQRARPQSAPGTASPPLLSPHDERDLIVAARRLGDRRLERWLAAPVLVLNRQPVTEN